MSQTATDIATNTNTRPEIDPSKDVALHTADAASIKDGRGPEVLRRVLAQPRYEVIPMRGVLAQVRALPDGSMVTVTCSPARGISATVKLAEQIQKSGYTAVPHLAARRFHSRSHLTETMARLTEAGMRDVFVVGGDGASESGPFSCGADLIAALAEIQPDLRSVGIPCYPEGHALIGTELLDEALRNKCFFAGHMVTQLCFDARMIGDWLARIRASGINLPVHIGIPGVIDRRKLLGIALRIGLGDSTRFLKKSSDFMGQFVGSSRFTPDALVDDLVPMLANAELGIAGLHINTFNQVEGTEAWRQDRLSQLDAQWPDASGVASSGAFN